MNDNVRKVFDMLGVEPNEKFDVKGRVCYFYKIDEKLNVFFKPMLEEEWVKSCIKIGDFLTGENEIIKLPKKKKLRDLTEEEYKKWYENNCGKGKCGKCPFVTANCHANSEYCWISHKDLYSDKFLDQEVEVSE